MRFDNAFLCKNGVVGMQFTYNNQVKGQKERAIISVFHDGESLKASEDAPPIVQQFALKKYHELHKRFKRN